MCPAHPVNLSLYYQKNFSADNPPRGEERDPPKVAPEGCHRRAPRGTSEEGKGTKGAPRLGGTATGTNRKKSKGAFRHLSCPCFLLRFCATARSGREPRRGAGGEPSRTEREEQARCPQSGQARDQRKQCQMQLRR